MIFTVPILLRIALISLVGVVVQLAGLSQMQVLGTVPDIVPVLVVSLGLLGGSLAGAAVGFSVGLLVDSALLQTLGVSSLILLGVGYLAGRYREVYDISSALVPPLLGGGLTLVAVSGFALMQFLLGVDSPVSLLLIRDMVVKSLLNVFLAVPVYLAIRRGLRAALIEDRPRRGRAYTAPIGIRPI